MCIVSYCVTVNKIWVMIVSNLIRPRFACFREIQHLQFSHSFSFIFATAATRYNNLIVPSRSLLSQLLPRPSLYRPHPETESRLLILCPGQRAVPTREVHLWRTCDSSGVLHLACPLGHVEPAPSSVPWFAHSRRKGPMVRRRLDHMSSLHLHMYVSPE